MKKMEAMMELLTEEIEGFNKLIGKLEVMSENFKDLNIKADTSNIEHYTKEFLRKQEETIISNEKRNTEMNQVLKSARITPNWLATMFCIVVSIQTLSLSYFAHHFVSFEYNHAAVFEEGLKEGNKSFRNYFEDHPVIYEDFQKWDRKEDSVPNQR